MVVCWFSLGYNFKTNYLDELVVSLAAGLAHSYTTAVFPESETYGLRSITTDHSVLGCIRLAQIARINAQQYT